MRFPFVSRDRYEREAIAWERTVQNWERRYDGLFEKYQALKVMGATEPDARQTLPPREVDPVVKAITEACIGKPAGIRNLMLRQVMRDRSQGLDEEEILKRIQQGIEVEDGLPA